jgi:branched-chain amino acid transport system ATP-binding protein
VSELLVAQRVEELIGLLGLGAFRDKYAGELSTGSRRIVELASLIAQRADVVLLDEPSAGIAQKEAEALGPLLRRLRDATGAAIVIVEHDVPLLLATCDRLVAMELGRVIADGDPSAVVRDARVVASYLGADEAAVSRSGARRGRATRRGSKRVVST